jgi:hypothetical protein
VCCGNNNDKVLLCHSAINSKYDFCVKSADVQSHLNHGDKLGACTTTASISTSSISLKEDIAAEEINATNMVMYPNPVKDVLNIKLGSLETGATVQVYNATGALLINQRLSNTTQAISVKGLASGVYYVQVNNRGKITTEKVLKQ